MTKILKKLCVANGKYVKEGQEKTSWKQIGLILESDNGGKFMLMDKTFNPAGVETEPGRTQIMISMFDADEKKENDYKSGNNDNLKQHLANGGDDLPF